jgi:hypothetical protein
VSRGGLFTFFSKDNPEMLLKVLDACAVNGRKWVFYSAGTNVGLSTSVLDTATGRARTYINPDRTPAQAVQDTDAFPCDGTRGALFGAASTAAFDFDRDLRRASEAPSQCVPGATTLCIDDAPGDRRYRLRVAFETTQGGGRAGMGVATPLAALGIASGGLFTFFSSDNPEMLIKVLDACAVNGRKWVFYSAGTNVALETEVTDTLTGESLIYSNADRNPAPPVKHLSAFSCP